MAKKQSNKAAILGPSVDAQSFLKNLDETKLVDLCSDMLSQHGHYGIRITDGPGDGQRDIHSIDPDGYKYLTQSKYHGNTGLAVSAKELAEVVMGMVRYDYKRGCFITNARISPQAKRDCLNDFPGLAIDFLDGLQLVKVVLGDLVLKAIWFDGTELERVSYALVIPVLARDLELDRPIRLLPPSQESVNGGTIQHENSQVQWKLSRNSGITTAFEPYRAPRIRTVSEFGTSILTTEVVLTGVIHLADIDGLVSTLVRVIFSHIENLFPRRWNHMAVRLGQVFLAPLGGEQSGSRLALEEYQPITMVKHEDLIEHELAWIMPSLESGWVPPKIFSTSVSDWVRWYHLGADICIDLTLLSPPSDFSRGLMSEEREYRQKWFDESLFMLVPNIHVSWEGLDIPEPTFSYAWYEDTNLHIWRHPNLNGPLRRSLIEPDELPEDYDDFSLLSVDVKLVQEEFNVIKEKLQAVGGSGIQPHKARYMVALVDRDPIPTMEITEYRTVDLLRDPEIVPSPIDPRYRRLEFYVCWILDPSPKESDLTITPEEILIQAWMQNAVSGFKVVAEVDKDRYGTITYLLMDLRYEISLEMRDIDMVLDGIMEVLMPVLDRIETILKEHFAGVQRATRRYWDEELFIEFPTTTPSES